MFRFTIRDVLWLTVVVAMGAGWWIDRLAQDARRTGIRIHALELRSALTNAKYNQDNFGPQWDTADGRIIYYSWLKPVDWKLADKPIPE
jgi:hypothetical protein